MNQMRGVKSRYDFSLDNRQVVLVVSGLILVLMLSFLMGTLFGKNLSRMSDQDKQVAAAPAAAEPAPATAPAADPAGAVETAAAGPGAASDSTRDDFIRNLESMKVPSGNEAAGEPAAEPAPTPPAMASLNPAGSPASAPADSAAPHTDKPADKPEPAKETITRPVIPMGTYTIQLASLPEKEEALALVKQLQSRKYEAYMLTVTLPGKGIFYRVRVGHYTDLNQAKKALAILQSREGKYFDAWITQ
ncbi:MAG TPA: SPOR domain-containing protein [bacterium]|nr:SPOR domain-containing protein [bacterium]